LYQRTLISPRPLLSAVFLKPRAKLFSKTLSKTKGPYRQKRLRRQKRLASFSLQPLRPLR
jgi:hypothetical protein